MFDQDLKKYEEIERKRRISVNKEIEILLFKRKQTNIKIEEEIRNLSKEITNYADNSNNIIDYNIDQRIEDDNIDCTIDNKYIKDISIAPEQNTILATNINTTDTSITNIPTTNTTTISNITNIPFTDELVRKLILTEKYKEIEEKIKNEKSKISKNIYINLKININKRLSQVSQSKDHTIKIYKSLSQITYPYLFIECFVLKLLEQGKLQVSIHFLSYQSYSLLLSLFLNNSLFGNELLEYFRVILFTQESTKSSLKGMYSIYFGVIHLNKMYQEAWFFIASLLNIIPSEPSLYVLESFLIILGEDLFKMYKYSFITMLKYVKEEYLTRITNDALKTRIETCIRNIIKE
ncbi:hypothetical protein CWI39_0102p0030 [Hamiltosporidium magnivora]|uniref:Uncharacterized protein n=1 Tax=Hamiltosporidium magnivora TaxID=148818 RepID=A0A4Q9LP71_9MICR|nr:hypothetical protein CWI39_0102p0030 [Hamiltosporidium magnivora]